jgi:microcystin-dependent protein
MRSLQMAREDDQERVMNSYFDNQRKMNRPSARALQDEKRLAGAGPNLPVLDEDPETVEAGAQWINQALPTPQIKAQLGEETYHVNMVPDGEPQAAIVEDPAPVGSGKEYYGAADPPGGRWMICDGRLLVRADYAELFAVIGTTFNTGGELATQFRIPDRRGRAGVGAGQGAGLTDRALGSRFGTETHTLTIAQMPSHDHSGSTDNPGGHSHNLTGNDWARSIDALNSGAPSGDGGPRNLNWLESDDPPTNSAGGHTHSVNIGTTGSGAAHPNMQPSIAVNYLIRAKP